jgi:hypothetical protein
VRAWVCMHALACVRVRAAYVRACSGVVQCACARACVQCACVREERSGAPRDVTPLRPKALGLHTSCARLLVEMDTCVRAAYVRACSGVVQCACARACVQCACVREERSGAPRDVTPSRPKALGLHTSCARLLVEMDTCAPVSMLRCSTVRACARVPLCVCARAWVYARVRAWVRARCVCARVCGARRCSTLSNGTELCARIVVPPRQTLVPQPPVPLPQQHVYTQVRVYSLALPGKVRT